MHACKPAFSPPIRPGRALANEREPAAAPTRSRGGASVTQQQNLRLAPRTTDNTEVSCLRAAAAEGSEGAGPFTLIATPHADVPRRSTRPVLAHVDSVTAGRFWAKVVRTSSHWWWTGAVSSGNGYGLFAVAHDLVVGAHRLALALALGRSLAPGEVACHACHEPLCVRVDPAHVHLGDFALNIHQLICSGRARRVNDLRGPAGRSRAIRDAVLAVVARGGSEDAAAVEEVVADAIAAGDPHRSQPPLPGLHLSLVHLPSSMARAPVSDPR